MLDLRKLQAEREQTSCYDHWHHPEVVLGNVVHCGNCGAIWNEVVPGELSRQLRIWRRCVEALGLRPKGHEYGRKG
jgi:hypothetical protein